MHREIAHPDQPFEQESNLSLTLLTALLGLLMAVDLWPALAAWATGLGLPLPSWPDWDPGYRLVWIAAVLGGVRVVYLCIESLLEGKVGADLALSVAVVAALLFQKPMVAAEVVFIGMLGECLEGFTFARTQRAVRRLVEVFPHHCWLLREGQEVRIHTRDVQPGDSVRVKPGGRVPVDGIVLEGRSAVDQSTLTGESLPIDKAPGDEVFAGTINQFGTLTIQARRVAEHTVAGQVIQWTSRALRDKAPSERVADRLARYFLPAVLAVAALTFLGSVLIYTTGLSGIRHGLADAIALSIDPVLAVLVVACPCPLILATPTALIAALGRLAGTGVLIKGGSALERLAEVSAFAFDKTGTLTEGRLVLGDIIPLGAISPDELLRLAASAEQPSEHLLARVITQDAAARSLPVEPLRDFQAHPGAGVVAHTASGRLIVGTRRLLAEQGIAIPEDVDEQLTRCEAAGQTTLLVARDHALLGILGARDQVRPEARGILHELHHLGIRETILLTGDRQATARAVAEDLGIAEVHAELLPQQKAEFITRWRQVSPLSRGKRGGGEGALVRSLWSPRPGRRIAMVGDGINDAPALAAADVGLAIGPTGTDIAAEAGDIVLMGDPLRSLPLLLRLSRQTVRIIHQNIIVFAFGVNLLGVALTAWLWPLLASSPEWYERAPLAAVIYHQLGSLLVLLNAARLLWFERPGLLPVWSRSRRFLHRLDHWLAHHLDLHEGVHWLGHHLRAAGLALAALVLAAYAASGLTQVGPDEVAVVRRFGRPLLPALGPGLHWCLPWPADRIVRLQPDRIRTVEIGFRVAPGASPTAAPLTWASAHGNGMTPMPEEAVMITGDGNLLELQATVRYAVDRDHLENFLFEVQDPEAILRASAESVLREIVAGRPFLDLLTSSRQSFQAGALDRLRRRCADYGSGGLGLRVEDLALHDLHPPQEVVPAYHEVTNAMEARDRQVNDAQAERIRALRAAVAQADAIVCRAQADAREIVRLAEAARDRFLARLQVRDSLNASLTDFRLFWDAIGAALAGREKMIIDSGKVPGRRHLFLADPDQFRLPAPVVVSPPRPPQDTPPEEPDR